MCKVSVIMPVYNEEDYVGAAISAILAQTHSDFELLLVDDGSTDKSGEICRSFAEADSRVIYLHQKNAGVSAARNFGLARATGTYVYFTDADDVTEPNLLADACSAAEQSGADIVAFGFFKEVFGKREQKRAVQTCLPANACVMNRASLAAHIRSCITTSAYFIGCHLFRLQALGSLRFPAMPIAEDAVFIINAVKRAQSIAFLQTAYYHYATRIGSAANRYQPRRLECDMVLLDSFSELFSSLGCDAADAAVLMNERYAGSYLNVIYNLCLPDCPFSFSARKREMHRAAELLQIRQRRAQFVFGGTALERLKQFMLRHGLEFWMLVFGRLFILAVRKR